MNSNSKKVPYGLLIGLSILAGLASFLVFGNDKYLWIGISIAWFSAIVSLISFLIEKSYFYLKKRQFLDTTAFASTISGILLVLIYFFLSLLENVGLNISSKISNLKESKLAISGALLFLIGISLNLVIAEIDARKNNAAESRKSLAIRIFIFVILVLLALIQLQLVFKLFS